MDTKIQKKLHMFFTQFKYHTYNKGEILIRADDTPAGIFYLKEGLVKEYIISKKGEELVLNIFKPVSFFPMSWAFNDAPNSYFFEAMNRVEVWRAPKQKVLDFIKKDNEILYDLISRTYKGTDGMMKRMAYLMSGGVYVRLLIEILISAKRFGVIRDNRMVEIEISEKDLAAQSGMTRETVSREIKILKDKNLITFSKNMLIIKNLDQLEDVLVQGS